MRNERGGGRLGVFIWIVIMALAIFVATKTIPRRIAVLEFHDYCDEQTQYAAASSRVGEEQVRNNVMQKARELEIPIESKKLKFEAFKNEVKLHLSHEVEVDLKFYNWVWKYDRTWEHIRF